MIAKETKFGTKPTDYGSPAHLNRIRKELREQKAEVFGFRTPWKKAAMIILVTFISSIYIIAIIRGFVKYIEQGII